MIQKTFELSIDGMKDLDAYLGRLKQAIEDYPKQFVNEVTDIGVEKLVMFDSTVRRDGNDDTHVTSTTHKKGATATGTINYKGYQVAYVEFGTGIPGENSPHPQAKEAGYDYYVPSIYKATVDGEKGWWYGNEFKVGIPSQRPVYNTARYLKENLKSIAKYAWKGVS